MHSNLAAPGRKRKLAAERVVKPGVQQTTATHWSGFRGVILVGRIFKRDKPHSSRAARGFLHRAASLEVEKLILLHEESTPNTTGQRLHRKTEAIPHRPWKSKGPFVSNPNQSSKTRGRKVLPRIFTVKCPVIPNVNSRLCKNLRNKYAKLEKHRLPKAPCLQPRWLVHLHIYPERLKCTNQFVSAPPP